MMVVLLFVDLTFVIDCSFDAMQTMDQDGRVP